MKMPPWLLKLLSHHKKSYLVMQLSSSIILSLSPNFRQKGSSSTFRVQLKYQIKTSRGSLIRAGTELRARQLTTIASRHQRCIRQLKIKLHLQNQQETWSRLCLILWQSKIEKTISRSRQRKTAILINSLLTSCVTNSIAKLVIKIVSLMLVYSIRGEKHHRVQRVLKQML